MNRIYYYISLLSIVVLAGCSEAEDVANTATDGNACKLQGIEATIEGAGSVTRAKYTPLADYVGRSDFKMNDIIMFTKICRTSPDPISAFIYPALSGGTSAYEGIEYKAASNGGGWARTKRFKSEGEPDDIYWSDAENPHTFEGYGIPNDDGFDWKKGTTPLEGKTAEYYIGSIGDPMTTGDIDYTIDYTADEYKQYKEEVKDGNDNVIGYVYKNPKLEKEDLLIAYDEKMQAETGGIAYVNFHHALSSVRVVVKISGFSSTDADNKTVVKDMYLLNQPTMYAWWKNTWETQPLMAYTEGSAVTNDQGLVDTAWGSTTERPLYDQRKDMKLWIPKPDGSDKGNSGNEFTFYGITTPQPSGYLSTVDAEYKKTKLKFTVEYPNPLKPSEMVDHIYTASLTAYFEPGFNTTINIQLNHEKEKMTVGAEYENWEYIATPDQGNLRKNSTFLQDIKRANVTIVGDTKATVDDATWLYQESADVIKDIYGHTGTSEADAYQISTADQLLSFAYEVTAGNGETGRDFVGKYIRLDADLTLQKDYNKVKPEIVLTYDDEGKVTNQSQLDNAAAGIEWIGIGADGKPFNGTFIGGNRFIHRLYGKPLFMNIGSKGRIEQLNVNALSINNQVYTIPTSFGGESGTRCAINGSGLFAETNAGHISGCRVVGDVSLNGTSSGAFIGTNEGVLFASYHVGETKGKATVGGLVGDNSHGDGKIQSCYQAGNVIGSGTDNHGITKEISGVNNSYFNHELFPGGIHQADVAEGRSSAQMTKSDFVDDLNSGITSWLTNYTGYEAYRYVYQPANYPIIEKGAPTSTTPTPAPTSEP